MKIQNHTPLNFKASISEQVKYQLYKQLTTCSARYKDSQRLSEQLEKQIKNISKWGSNDSEIIITTDEIGRYRLGLQYNITSSIKFSHPFKGLQGRTELSQFLSLKESDILKTEDKIVKNMHHSKKS